MAKQKKHTKIKADVWFTPVRGSYLPASQMGWLLYVPFIAYLVFTVIVGINNTSSNAVAVLYIVPNWIAAVVVMTYIAAHKS